MKFNIAYPVTGMQKVVEVDDERQLRAFYDKRISHEVEGEALGEAFKGYVFKITGGNDKQGFAMKQGVLTNTRVRLLLKKGLSGFRERRAGERKRKSVRGCIVGSDLAILNLVVVKRGEQDVAGLTDQNKPRRLGPKRATRIRKLFNLGKKDDVRPHVIRRTIAKDGKKSYTKAPKIQRLVTPQRRQRKRQQATEKRKRYEKSRLLAKEYNDIITAKAKAAKHVEPAKEAPKAAPAKEAPKAAPAKAAPAKAAAAAPAKAAPAKAAAPAKPAAAAAPAKAAPKADGKKKGK